jgi:hypothetical protein
MGTDDERTALTKALAVLCTLRPSTRTDGNSQILRNAYVAVIHAMEHSFSSDAKLNNNERPAAVDALKFVAGSPTLTQEAIDKATSAVEALLSAL